MFNNKKAQQITRATWIFILLIYFSTLTAFLVAYGSYMTNYDVEVSKLNVFDKFKIDIVNGISSIPAIITLLCYGIPLAFLIYLVAVSIINPGS